jgi:uncharacterized membrane protein
MVAPVRLSCRHRERIERKEAAMHYRTEIEIDAPVEVIWRIMSDVERWSEWTASIDTIERLDDGPFAVGSKAKVKQPKLPEAEWTVTDLQDGRAFTWEASGPGMRTQGVHRVEGEGDEVRGVLEVHSTGFLAPLFGLFYSGMTRRYVDMEAAGLKKRSEAEASGGT